MADRTKKDMLERQLTDVAGAALSQCQHCDHLWRIGTEDGNKWYCAAYPYTTQGIPRELLALGAGIPTPHGEKHSGQAGNYVYKPKIRETSSGIQYEVLGDWSIRVSE